MNQRQFHFALEYAVDANATQAAIRAGYSPRTAANQGSRLLDKVEVQRVIANQRKKLELRTGVTAERVRLELARVAFSDMADFIQWGRDGVKWFDSADLDKDQTAVIAEVVETIREVDEGDHSVTLSTKRFKLHDKIRALTELAKIMGLYPKDNAPGTTVNVNVSQPQNVRKLSEMSDEELELYERIVAPHPN